MEVLLGKDENVVLHDAKTTQISLSVHHGQPVSTYGFVQKHGGEEVVEDFADLGVLRNVLVVLLHELDLARGQVGEHLVVEIHVGLHRSFQLLLS